MNTEGLLIADRPVIAKAQFVTNLPWRFLVGANILYQTGRLWSRQVRVAGSRLPRARPTINSEANTGDRRVADQTIVDVRLQKEFRSPEPPMPGVRRLPEPVQQRREPGRPVAAGRSHRHVRRSVDVRLPAPVDDRGEDPVLGLPEVLVQDAGVQARTTGRAPAFRGRPGWPRAGAAGAAAPARGCIDTARSRRPVTASRNARSDPARSPLPPRVIPSEFQHEARSGSSLTASSRSARRA